jgi:hypothetical protein
VKLTASEELDALVMALTEKCQRENTYDALYDDAAAAITTLRAQLAEARAMLDDTTTSRHKNANAMTRNRLATSRARQPGNPSPWILPPKNSSGLTPRSGGLSLSSGGVWVAMPSDRFA